VIPVERGWLAFWMVIAAGFFSTLLSIVAFRRLVDGEKLRVAVNRVMAHLFEFRLFASEPLLLLLRAQRDLLLANGQMLKECAKPLLVLTIPLALLFAALDGFVGHAPLPVNETAVVTTSGAQPELPARMQIDSPPVHILRLRQVSWRVRAIAPGHDFGWPAAYDRPAQVLHHHWLLWYFAGMLLACLAFYIGRAFA
jgi:uncharacterized membrane protein (DUF106 family)